MATQINNYASATYAYSGRVGQENIISNTATTNLITPYAISGYKDSLNNSFRAGQNMTYYIHIVNEGTSPLYNVTVSDNLGGSGNLLTYLTGSAILNLDGEISSINPTTLSPLTFVIPGSFSPNSKATITYIAQVSSGITNNTTEITNSATIQASEESEGGTTISVLPIPTKTLPIDDFALVSMTKSVSTNEINIDEPFSFNLTLVNRGNLEATNITITDILPENFVISSITSETGNTQTTIGESDYSLDTTTNTLTLPSTTSTLNISVPPATGTVEGTTTITINGRITE